MTYQLKNKDKVILEFEVEIKENSIFDNISYEQKIENVSIYDENLPITINKNDLNNSLRSWIDKRKIPSSREFAEKIVATYSSGKGINFMDYIGVSLGLSLNDTFWIVLADSKYKWSDYNLYKNKFDEALSLVAFSGVSHKVSGFTSSPEYTTNGMLKKCWHRDGDNIYLFKGSMRGFANWGKEPYCEFYMAQIADILGLEHIAYDLKEFHGQIVSSCKIFTSEKEGYMPIFYLLLEDEKKYKGASLINAVSKIYSEERLRDLLMFDSIIYNIDRHLGNFGMIIDNDALMPLRPAPIFDNGFSIINMLTKDELLNINEALKTTTAYFDIKFDEQLRLAVDERHLEGLEKLGNFEFEKHPKFNLSDEWLEPIQNHIKDRAKFAIKLYDNQKNSNKINKHK